MLSLKFALGALHVHVCRLMDVKCSFLTEENRILLLRFVLGTWAGKGQTWLRPRRWVVPPDNGSPPGPDGVKQEAASQRSHN